MTAVAMLALFLVALGMHLADACSCMPEHPQQSYCRSDFVIVARVKKMAQKEDTRIFKIKIKKIFKATCNKTHEALQTGMLWTAGDDAMCGVDLMIDKTYLLAGNVVKGHARISLCSYHKLWDNVTNKQRKGFRLLYKPTCATCQVLRMTWWGSKVTVEQDECLWDTNSYSSNLNLPDCQALYGICTRQPSGHCGWMSDRLNQDCTKQRKSIRKEELDKEP